MRDFWLIFIGLPPQSMKVILSLLGKGHIIPLGKETGAIDEKLPIIGGKVICIFLHYFVKMSQGINGLFIHERLSMIPFQGLPIGQISKVFYEKETIFMIRRVNFWDGEPCFLKEDRY